MNKHEFIQAYAIKIGVTYNMAEEYLNGFIKLVYETLREGKKVNIVGFGQFSVSHRKPRIGVNPRTGEKITIPELNTPKFKSGEGFKSAIKLTPQK